MNPNIFSIATSVPPYQFDQHETVEKMIHVFSLDTEKAEKLRKLYHNSGIQTRYSVLSDFQKERKDWHFWNPVYPNKIPSTADRNKVYKKEAPKLAYEAADKALKIWGKNPSEITHVISVSCTGVAAPGIEFELMHSLGLNQNVNRLGINFMGCFGAFKGLNVAQAFAKENPSHRILLVCTELCSLHLQADQNIDNILANSLFSDGAAAVIVGSDPKKNEHPLWTIEKQAAASIDNTLNKMGWEIGDQGFSMLLSPQVPVYLGRHTAPFVSTLLNSQISVEDCMWAIHPGGKSIIQAIEKALLLQPPQTQASWNTLARFGNMSSATFLFVLEQLLEEKNHSKWTVGLGFGPGLSMEGILLKRGKQ